MSKTETQRKKVVITAVLLGLLALGFYVGFFILINNTH
jgi:hypothetical protein